VAPRRQYGEPRARSACFTWAGHVAFRSDWTDRGDWMFFRPGPGASGLADNAQLGIQLMVNRQWLLTDPGYCSYSNGGRLLALGCAGPANTDDPYLVLCRLVHAID